MKKGLFCFAAVICMAVSAFSFAACDGANKPTPPTSPTQPSTPVTPTPHEHTYANTWTTSETEHWHAATCEHTSETKDKAAHNFNGDECSVCHYTKNGGTHTHGYETTWTTDGDYHWHKTTCGHDGIVTDTEKSKAAHDFNGNECSICHYVKNETQNKYKEIANACKTLVESTDKNNVEILTVFSNADGYLEFCAKHNKGYTRYIVEIEVGTTFESLMEIKLNALINADLYDLNFFPLGVYSTNGMTEDKQMVESMIAKLVGDGYNVIYGTITKASDKGADSILGSSAAFDVYALLEKDGVISEYSVTVKATKDLNVIYGDVYQAVLNSTENNKDTIYKIQDPTRVELGELADKFYAELKK